MPRPCGVASSETAGTCLASGTLTDCDDRGCETTSNGEPRCALLTAPWRPPCSCSSSRRRLGTLTMRAADGPTPGSAAPRRTAGRPAQVGQSRIRYPLPAGGSCRMGPWCRSTLRALPPTVGSTCAGGAGNSQARSSGRTSAQHVYGSRPMANPPLLISRDYGTATKKGRALQCRV
jgi:hypothetical protein